MIYCSRVKETLVEVAEKTLHKCLNLQGICGHSGLGAYSVTQYVICVMGEVSGSTLDGGTTFVGIM